jgi:colanic acid/amylovoran biosynthesis protein
LKILVTNAHSVLNAGDRVLLEVTLEQLRANFLHSEITVATNDLRGIQDGDEVSYVGSFTSWFKSAEEGIDRWHRNHLLMLPWWALQSWLVALTLRHLKRPWPMPKNSARRDLLAAYCKADLIVSCPGNFFFSGAGLGVPFLLAVCALAYGWLLGKPLYMMPQTIGPLTRRRERWLLGAILKQMRFVSLRDKPSLLTVTALGVAADRCHVLPDSAFLFCGSGDLGPFAALLAGPSQESRDAPDVQSSGGEAFPRPYIGVTVIDWAAMNRRFTRQGIYERAVAAALSSFLARHGGTVFIFPQVTGPSHAEDDRISAARIAGMLAMHQSQVVQVNSVWSPGQLKAAYGQMDLFLGTRLHSNIFALTAGTLVLAIAYQYKTHGMLEMLGLSDWVIDIEDVDERQLTERLELLWQRRSEVRTLIQQRLPALQQEARNAVAWIAADYWRRQD